MNQKTLLLRQINPSWIREGRATSQAFRPTRKDDLKLSVSDGDMITPENAWKQYTSLLGFSSEGVLAVSVAECESCELTARSQPLPDQPEHAIIDFSATTSNGQIERCSKKLVKAAQERDWIYRP